MSGRTLSNGNEQDLLQAALRDPDDLLTKSLRSEERRRRRRRRITWFVLIGGVVMSATTIA
ncbi:MAG TPA: hypothetical protein VF175_09070, partial [Lacipirellula sp.]